MEWKQRQDKRVENEASDINLVSSHHNSDIG